jgi:hypothetical protein
VQCTEDTFSCWTGTTSWRERSDTDTGYGFCLVLRLRWWCRIVSVGRQWICMELLLRTRYSTAHLPTLSTWAGHGRSCSAGSRDCQELTHPEQPTKLTNPDHSTTTALRVHGFSQQAQASGNRRKPQQASTCKRARSHDQRTICHTLNPSTIAHTNNTHSRRTCATV